jgi:undecaprenyl-diphosphatase
MPTVLEAALLGVVQGVTEFLPISSTAHLLIGERLLGYEDPGGVFTVMIQLGSILAVMWLYRAKLMEVLSGLPASPQARRFVLALLVAFMPAVIVGGLAAGFVTDVLYESPRVIVVTTVLGGVAMLVVERVQRRPVVTDALGVPLPRALAVGCCQTLALVPGVSRSGATIVGGMVAGLDRAAAAEFSFFLAMPTMTAAFVKSLLDVRAYLAPERGLEIAVGFVTAFAASALVVKPFLTVVQRSGFGMFAWYRILVGMALAAALGAGWL